MMRSQITRTQQKNTQQTKPQQTAHYHLPGLFEFYDLYKVFLPFFSSSPVGLPKSAFSPWASSISSLIWKARPILRPYSYAAWASFSDAPARSAPLLHAPDISAARNPHIKCLHTDQVVSFSCIHLKLLLSAYAQNLYFIQAALLTKYHINPSKPKRIPQLYASGSEKNDISFTVYYLMLTTLYPASLTILLSCSSSSSRS